MENTSSLWRHHPAPKTLFLCEVYSNILKECEYTSQRRQLRCVFNAFSLPANYPLQIKPETSPLPLPALQYNPCSPAGGRERSLKDLSLFRPREFCRRKTRGKWYLAGVRCHVKSVFAQQQGTLSIAALCRSSKSILPYRNTAGKYNFITRNKPPHYAILIPHLNLELPHLLRQPLDTILVLPRQVVYLMYRAVNLLHSCRHFVHAFFDD